jgi:phage terminase Nu1 subunit (DNA packaging protein)
LCATTGVKLDGMDLSGRRYDRERKAIARVELDALVSTEKRVTSYDTARSEYVALFTICIGEESEIGRTIRIILDSLNLGRYVEFFTTEVDDTIDALVASTATTRSDATVAITALLIVYACDETAFWLFLGDVLLVSC